MITILVSWKQKQISPADVTSFFFFIIPQNTVPFSLFYRRSILYEFYAQWISTCRRFISRNTLLRIMFSSENCFVKTALALFLFSKRKISLICRPFWFMGRVKRTKHAFSSIYFANLTAGGTSFRTCANSGETCSHPFKSF